MRLTPDETLRYHSALIREAIPTRQRVAAMSVTGSALRVARGTASPDDREALTRYLSGLPREH